MIKLLIALARRVDNDSDIWYPAKDAIGHRCKYCNCWQGESHLGTCDVMVIKDFLKEREKNQDRASGVVG